LQDDCNTPLSFDLGSGVVTAGFKRL